MSSDSHARRESHRRVMKEMSPGDSEDNLAVGELDSQVPPHALPPPK